ncbi:vacuolar protein sorting-associated protein 35, partial [Kipferlia bialata]
VIDVLAVLKTHIATVVEQGVLSYPEMYDTVQSTANVLPRLYLMVTEANCT